ncbi:MAG: hypothetical protein K2Q01_02170 [Rickettsiales bacterium]|nr:hypothetical protein [Rickettsiales bacterium]
MNLPRREWLSLSSLVGACRRHPTRAGALALPLLLALWCALTKEVGHYGPAPQYDVLYATSYQGESANALHIEIAQGRGMAVFVGENFGYGWPRLMRFNPATGKNTEITFRRPRNLPVAKPYNRPSRPMAEEPRMPVPIPALEKLHLDTSETSPDGFRFTLTPPRPPQALLSFWDEDEGGAYLVSDGRTMAIPKPTGRGADSPSFLAWILP